MYRKILQKLKQWKDNPHRKPLIIKGARQVGKTYIMREFALQEYENSIYVNFDSNPVMTELFSADFNTARLIRGMETYYSCNVIPGKTLLIFDEIQETPRAISALKYFCEDAPQYHIVCAGSLLGIAMHKGFSFPVGKAEFLELRPMDFTEFLLAAGEDRLHSLIMAGDWEMASVFKGKLTELLKSYLFTGGMPEAVLAFTQKADYAEIRQIQQHITDAYRQDFSKHTSGEQAVRIRNVFDSIPSQLAKENRKFIYGALKTGARAREYESAIMWLCDCGIIHRISNVTAPLLPLKSYEDLRNFKLFFLDVGLLGCMAGLGAATLINKNELFKEFKGALTEQFVLQELKACGLNPFYYSSKNSQLEIDFLADARGMVIPIEVKAEINLQAKSLKVFIEKNKSEKALRFSLGDYKSSGVLTDVPLYGIARAVAENL